MSRSVYTMEGRHDPHTYACERGGGLYSSAAVGSLLFGALHCCVRMALIASLVCADAGSQVTQG